PRHIWAEAPDPETVAPVVNWIAALGAISGSASRAPAGQAAPPWRDANVGWCIQTPRKKMDLFADLWIERPKAVYFGTEKVRRLLIGLDSVTPKIKVTATGIDWFAVSAEW